MTTEVKAALKVFKEFNYHGSIATLRKARVTHKCHGCGQLIDAGEEHAVVYVGKGLYALKFPDRYHKECL